ncbi:DoxX family membrane protein [Actibacterium sp. XHP0104]|uniref:DoxX family membrane protein n=1 Tax=Actibacterium sp. XHP0104 TaxID=2984335 RepID=UPI0021E87D93|nr:DoxX family membrane protein [Actibacterium sp. XHP0104]MCV2881284.1 DoxX family membrane protein [Actibacterium sp. XHP0104]
MKTLINIHNSAFGMMENRLAPALIPTLLRFTFAAILLFYFWNSANTKLDGLFTPTLGAYAQIFPRVFESVGYDINQMTVFHRLVVLAGAYAEYLLPLLLLLGLFTRLAALGMIGFVAVQTLTDLFGHGAISQPATLGAWFDGAPDSLIMDQRLFWIVLLIGLVLRGGGPLSLDRLLKLQ